MGGPRERNENGMRKEERKREGKLGGMSELAPRLGA